MIMFKSLDQKRCKPCEGGAKALAADKAAALAAKINQDWRLSAKKIKRVFKFSTFKDAVVFMHRVADIAEHEGHHPDITIHYNKVTLELSTHAIRGLSENDFILASKIDRIKRPAKF